MMMNRGEKYDHGREKWFHKGQEDSLLHQRREARTMPYDNSSSKLYFLTPFFAPFLYIYLPL